MIASDGWTPLTRAAAQGRTEAVQTLLAQGADANVRNGYCMTALMYAVKRHFVDIVEMLLGHGVDIDLTGGEGLEGGFTALIFAVKLGDATMLELLLDRGADVNARSKKGGYTPLMHAASGIYAESVQIEITQLLLAHGADVNAKDKDGKTVLMAVAESLSTCTRLSTILLEYGADVNATDKYGKTALMHVAKSDFGHVARALLNRRANVNAVSTSGMTALMHAAQHNNSDIVQILLDHGADVNVHKNGCTTALTLAAEFGHDDIVKMLLRFPDLNISGECCIPLALKKTVKNGHTDVAREFLANHEIIQQLKRSSGLAMSLIKTATGMGRHEIADLLTEATASSAECAEPIKEEEIVEQRLPPELKAPITEKTRSLFLASIMEERIGLVIEILTKHPDAIEIVNQSGSTPLLLATRYCHIDFVRLLLLQGADVNAADLYYMTPLMVAIGSGRSIDVIRCLLDYGADVNAVNAAGQTALMRACVGGRQDIAEALLARGASRNIVDGNGLTALEMAKRGSHLDIVRLLSPTVRKVL